MTKEEVNEILRLAKLAVTEKRAWIMDRDKNQATFAELGITKSIALGNILDLTYRDYCKGPEDDHNEPGELWFFADNYDGYELYIKFKFYGPDQSLKIISYHKAEHGLNRFF